MNGLECEGDMTARITINIAEDGELEIWLNEAGRDQLVKGLRRLSESSDHFHLGQAEGSEVLLSSRTYRPSDKLIRTAKVLFRTDNWDRQYFPHVFGANAG